MSSWHTLKLNVDSLQKSEFLNISDLISIIDLFGSKKVTNEHFCKVQDCDKVIWIGLNENEP